MRNERASGQAESENWVKARCAAYLPYVMDDTESIECIYIFLFVVTHDNIACDSKREKITNCELYVSRFECSQFSQNYFCKFISTFCFIILINSYGCGDAAAVCSNVCANMTWQDLIISIFFFSIFLH